MNVKSFDKNAIFNQMSFDIWELSNTACVRYRGRCPFQIVFSWR